MDSDRVILIFPAFSNATSETVDRPPLGILTVAAPLVADGLDVFILDERVEDDFDNILLKELQKDPICVGISSMSVNHITSALRVSELIKKNSNVPVIWGGVHPSLVPEATLKHEFVDFIVMEDGEETFQVLLESLKKESPDFHNIPGVGFKKDGQIVINKHALPARLEKLPPIPFHLVDFNKYDPYTGVWADTLKLHKDEALIPIETSRGCPFSCAFCTESVRKKKWRELSPSKVIDSIKFYIQTYGIRNFTFIDDNFFGNIKRSQKIVDLMAREKLDIRWYTNCRTDFMAKADPAFIKKLQDVGCRMLTFGAESGSEKILRDINKNATKQDVILTNRKLANSEICPSFFTIRGFPDETKRDVLETYQLIIQLKLENHNALTPSDLLIPTPGTKMAKLCLGDETENYSLENWINIIDNVRKGKPPWVLEETYDFIQDHKAFFAIVGRLNELGAANLRLYRFLLKIYKISFQFRFSIAYDRILQLGWWLKKTLDKAKAA